MKLKRGDRVRLTKRSADAMSSRPRCKENWRHRKGTVDRVRYSGNISVKWDDRTSLDEWPPQALELIMAASILQMTEEVKVTVKGSDYQYEGTLVGIATKRSGKIRYIVEDDNGRLFIHNATQIGKAEGWMP